MTRSDPGEGLEREPVAVGKRRPEIADLFNVPRTTVYGHLDSASKGTPPTSQRSRAKA